MKCKECNEEASFFHSKCCGVHFEGIITKKGELRIACENCEKDCGKVIGGN